MKKLKSSVKTLTFGILILISTVNIVEAKNAELNWELKKEAEGIRVFTKNDGNSTLKAYKAETIIYANIDSIFNFLIDFDAYKDWMVSCSESKTIHKGINHFVYISRLTLPWPFQDRLTVSDVRIKLDEDGVIYAYTSPSDIKYEVEDTLPLKYFKASYTLIPISKSKVKFIMNGVYDPGGGIPSWLTNFFIAEGPFGTIQVMKKNLE